MEHVVGFVGCECEDIVLYLARIMHALGKKTVIIDRTEQEMLLEILGADGQGEHTVREEPFYDVRVTNQGVSYEEYDLVFLVFGYRLNHPKLFECGKLVMITDGVPAHAALLKKLGCWERRQCLVIRNLVPMKHTEKYLAGLADSEEPYCEIPQDERDIRIKCSLGSYECGMIKGLSPGMKQTLINLTGFLEPGYPEKQIRKVMKKL